MSIRQHTQKILHVLLYLSIFSVSLNAQYVWRPKACLPGIHRVGIASFAVRNHGYVVGGYGLGVPPLDEVWEYDGSTDSWTQKAAFPGKRSGPAVFVINDTAYVGLGLDAGGVYHTDFYRYEAATDQWTPIANFPGTPRYFTMTFSINGKGYVGCGKGGAQYNDFYEYDPGNNTWTAKASFPGNRRQNGFGAAVGGYGYFGLGYDGGPYADVYRYDANGNNWTQMASLPSSPRWAESYFVLNDTIYVVAGRTANSFFDHCWRYDVAGNAWIQEQSFTCIAPPRSMQYGFTINGHGYVTCGATDNTFYNDLLEFGPEDLTFLHSQQVLGNDTSICGAFSLILSTGNNCTKWSTGVTGAQITVNAPGSYSARWPGQCLMNADTITITTGPPPVIQLGNDTAYCGNFSRILSTGSANTVWSTGAIASQITVSSPGAYSATLTNSCGTSSDTVVISSLIIPTVNLGPDTTLCSGQSLQLDATNSNSTYRWQDNSTNATYNVATAGAYSVTVTNTSGCSASDAINVMFNTQPPVVDLGNDTTYCNNFTKVLSTGDPNTVWSTGVSASQISISSPGIYWASLSNQCFTASDTVTINQASIATLNLGPDTTLCTGQTITLDATSANSTYLWQDNSTNATYNVTTAGNYSVTVTNTSGCSATDAVNVGYDTQAPVIDLGNDTSYCGNFSRTLSANQTVVWSTGATAGQIVVTAPGTYWATGSNGCGTSSDTVAIASINPPTLNITGGGHLCNGDSLPLTANTPATSVLWNTGSSAYVIEAHQPGVYTVQAWDDPSCKANDSATILAGLPPIFNLGNDTSTCGTQGVLLNIPIANATFNWSDNSTDSFLHVYSSGIYSVTVNSGCGVATGSIHVDVFADECALLIPTGFSPNGDGKNDFFHAICHCPVTRFNMKIYNRWGEQVFSSNNIEDGWDGSFRDRASSLGVFVYYIEYFNYCEGKMKKVVGNVTLVK